MEVVLGKIIIIKKRQKKEIIGLSDFQNPQNVFQETCALQGSQISEHSIQKPKTLNKTEKHQLLHCVPSSFSFIKSTHTFTAVIFHYQRELLLMLEILKNWNMLKIFFSLESIGILKTKETTVLLIPNLLEWTCSL